MKWLNWASEIAIDKRGMMLALSAPFVLIASAAAQKPVAELPRVRLDTTWNQPKDGRVWQAHTSEELAAALEKSAPGTCDHLLGPALAR
jgi:hypothetical protein